MKERLDNAINMKPLIFIVDDDVFFRNYISTILTMNSLDNTLCFSSGELCIENLHQKPDLIILDHDMNGMSGTEVLRYLQSQNLKTPVIMVSSRDEDNLISEVINLGVHKFIKKDMLLCQNLKDYFKSYENAPVNY
jgi:DNA-binding NarL/FixJ family response regulator